MYSVELQQLLLKEPVIKVELIKVIEYLKLQFSKPQEQWEVPYLWYLLIQLANKDILTAYLLENSIKRNAFLECPPLNAFENICSVTHENITIEDGVCYFTESGHLDYLSNLKTFKKLKSSFCPVTRSPIRWLIKLSDLNQTQLDFLKTEKENTLKSTEDISDEFKEWAETAPKLIPAEKKTWLKNYKAHSINELIQTTLLYSLCLCDYRIGLLAELDPSLLQSLPQREWLTCSSAFKSKGITPLYLLCAVEKGREFLLSQPSEFLQKIPTKAWTKIVLADSHDKGRAAFNWLCIDVEIGHAILRNQTDDFFNQLPRQVWLITSADDDGFKNMNSLASLSRMISGLEIIATFSSATLHKIPLDAWAMTSKEGRTALSDICSEDISIKILSKNPKLFFEKMPLKSWQQPVPYHGNLTHYQVLLISSLAGQQLARSHADYFAPLRPNQTKLFNQPKDTQTKEQLLSCLPSNHR